MIVFTDCVGRGTVSNDVKPHAGGGFGYMFV